MTIEERLQALEEKVAHQEAVNAVNEVVLRYSYLHDADQKKEVMKLFVQHTPGGSLEIGNEGRVPLEVFMSKDWSNLENEVMPGRLPNHFVTTPWVTIAKDGKSAKALYTNIITECGIWPEEFDAIREMNRPDIDFGQPIIPGFKVRCEWFFERVRIDLLVEDGEWRLYRIHTYNAGKVPMGSNMVAFALEMDKARKLAKIKAAYDTEVLGKKPPRNEEFETWLPSTFQWEYSIDGPARGYTPRIPEDFDTYDFDELP